MNTKTVAVISFVLFCFLCMADHQMGQIKLAEATSSRMPLIVSAKHVPIAGDIVVYPCTPRGCEKGEACCDCDVSKVPPACLKCCHWPTGGRD
ncbi:hypothetical protein ACFXTH_011693 [Malus domestica]